MRKDPERKSDNISRYVLDTYALQAFLTGELGAEIVADILRRAAADKLKVYVSCVSLAEIYYVTSLADAFVWPLVRCITHKSSLAIPNSGLSRKPEKLPSFGCLKKRRSDN